MTKRKTKHVPPGLKDDDVPAWIRDDPPDRSTPYTEAELDLLVEGTLDSIRDTAVWKNIVRQVGKEEERRVLRSRLIMNDENAGELPDQCKDPYQMENKQGGRAWIIKLY